MAQKLEPIFTAYNEAVSDGDRERALKVVRGAVAAGVRPEDVVSRIVIPAIEQMAKQIAQNPDASLAQNFLMARIGAAVTEEMVKQFLAPPPIAGRVILGTAVGDMHSLGKTIVGGCLKSLMFDVIDLGISVSPESFVDAATARNAQVIGVSSMMAHTAVSENGSLGVRRILKQRGLEGRIKLVVGGAPYLFDPLLYRSVQADGWAPDGVSAGKVIGDLIKEIGQ
jgi:methylmalonyl-CoA mutase cobalamin-binding domain/chain